MKMNPKIVVNLDKDRRNVARKIQRVSQKTAILNESGLLESCLIEKKKTGNYHVVSCFSPGRAR